MRTVHFDHMSAGGVSYSLNPATGDDEIVINANYGQNSTVTGGSVEPDEFIVNKTMIVITSKRLGEKHHVHMIPSNPAPPEALIVNGMERCSLGEVHRQTYCMLEAEIREVASVTAKIEEHFGYPVDVEWQFGPEHKLYVLQVRRLQTE